MPTIPNNPQKRNNGVKLKQQYGVPGPLKAIRLKCRDCQGGAVKQIAECNIPSCELWPYRMGRNPHESDLHVPQFNPFGDLMSWRKWQGYRFDQSCEAGTSSKERSQNAA